MNISAQRRLVLICASGALCAVLVGAVLVAGLLYDAGSSDLQSSEQSQERSQERSPRSDTASTATSLLPSVAVSSSTTTTSVAIEYQTLPQNTHEIATVRSFYSQVQVQAAPPTGWDKSLSPVVSASETLTAPRSVADTDRVPIPSIDYPVSGRAVTPNGWVFSNPGTYNPP
ncbi:MAG: hypothetical protein WD029_06100, partial [Microthrixaceae bacterium]